MIETYTDRRGTERCDNCGTVAGECVCCCSDCGDHVTECACDEGPTYPAVADREDDDL
jgi:hypothetical protein